MSGERDAGSTLVARGPASRSFKEVRLHRSVAELTEVQEFWTRTQLHPNSDFEHFLLVCELRGEVLSPCVVSLWIDGRCCCIVAGRLERQLLKPSIGYARLPGFWVTAITIIHSGIIGTLDAHSAKLVADELESLLGGGDADVAIVNLLSQAEPLSGALRMLRSCRTRHPKWVMHRTLTLHADAGFLLKAMRPKHRYWIKRKEKDLAAAFPQGIRWSWFPSISGLPDLCEKMEAVAQTTYQRGMGAGFVNDEDTRARLALFARRNQLRVFLVEIDGKPEAFWMGVVYHSEFHSWATGYTQDFSEFEIGTLMFLRMVDKLAEEGVTKFDFGLGDAHYKQRFGDHAWEEATIRLFGPSIKAAILGSLLAACDSLDLLARRLATRFGVADRVKQRWRARFHKQATRGSR